LLVSLAQEIYGPIVFLFTHPSFPIISIFLDIYDDKNLPILVIYFFDL